MAAAKARFAAAALALAALGPAAPALRAAPGFYDFESLPPRSRPAVDRRPAAVHLSAERNEGRTCSGVFISRRGHILTAGHCVRRFLSKASRRETDYFDITDHGRDATAYDGPSGLLDTGLPLRLAAAGRGTMAVRGEIDVEKAWDDIQRMGDINSGDWAILVRQGGGETTCAPALASAPSDDTPVWIYGFPAAARRDADSAPGSPGQLMGERLLVTTGRTIRALDKVERILPPYRAASVLGDILISDADSMEGMSGAGMFDRGGSLLGIHVESRSGPASYVRDSARGVSAQKIFAALSGAGLDPADYFSCR